MHCKLSELKQEHNWCTRMDPFGDTWDGIKGMLSIKWKFLFKILTHFPEGYFLI